MDKSSPTSQSVNQSVAKTTDTSFNLRRKICPPSHPANPTTTHTTHKTRTHITKRKTQSLETPRRKTETPQQPRSACQVHAKCRRRLDPKLTHEVHRAKYMGEAVQSLGTGGVPLRMILFVHLVLAMSSSPTSQLPPISASPTGRISPPNEAGQARPRNLQDQTTRVLAHRRRANPRNARPVPVQPKSLPQLQDECPERQSSRSRGIYPDIWSWSWGNGSTGPSQPRRGSGLFLRDLG
ncbi:hypothetical protein FE257_004223 [Aspergillus nanangensis]|uniref:Uncharacterized protein n=1 Tax=Aspergillus nanangensis TaxID=2582783 RepID=A0AAD4CRZ6_ASPNN|nr:hypothetical protein FE257_004223 [Aspergillus nanangensis]